MALTKFKLVGHEKLKGLNYKGNVIPFDKIDDTLAEELFGKTHVLEWVGEAPATVPVQLALAESAAEVEAPSTKPKK
jgi:hypothetical protein